MSGSFEKSVKGATKVKLAPPKAKYVDHILTATRTGEAGVGEVFRTLDLRLRDSTWTIAFKSLILVHLMIREGEPDATLRCLATNPKRLAPSSYADVQTQGRNIQNYSAYLMERAKQYRKAQFDYVRGGEDRLKTLSVDKGLLWETECVQSQIRALLKCDFLTDDVDNEITITGYRLLTMDLLALFRVMNQGAINVLEHYFEMSKPDAERSLGIYRTFARQTDEVVKFLAVARQYEYATKLEIPKIKHAPTSLAASLEEYLNDKDFDINRRQYLAQQQAKKSGRPLKTTTSTAKSESAPTRAAVGQSFPDAKATPSASTTTQQKGPAPDLIDFFESIEQQQQPMAQAPPSQFQQQQQFSPQAANFLQQQNGQLPMGYQQQQPINQMNFPGPSSAFGQMQQPQQQPQQVSTQNSYTGNSFGGFSAPQSPPMPWPQQPNQPSIFQNAPQSPQYSSQPFNSQGFQQNQTQATNPFRSSTMPTATGQPLNSFSNMSGVSSGHSANNPFARTDSAPIFSTQMPQSPQNPTSLSNPQTPATLQPQRTGTNPFARGPSPNTMQPGQGGQVQASSISTNATGSTNPFRQSAFVNQQTGQGWQAGPQGAFSDIPTIPVFPRPGQPQQQQQQAQPQPQSWI